MGGVYSSISTEYNPFSNVNIYGEMEALQSDGYIQKLSINHDAFQNDLFTTFSLTKQTFDGVSQSFDYGKYCLSLIRSVQSINPEIHVRFPNLAPNTPHLWYNRSLCLYHPKNFQWEEEKNPISTVISWTYGWIYFYETWLLIDEWLGPEIKH